MKKCPNCFAEVPDYTVYCPHCYKKITGPAETAPKPAAAKPAAVPKAAPAAKKCPGCGKEAPDGAAFCPYCGTRLMNEAQNKAPSTQQTTQQTAQQNENPEKWIREALDQAEIWQEAGVDKEEMRWYTTAVERAELAWKRSQTLENKRKLTRVYETAGDSFAYRDPLYTDKMCRKMLALWQDDPSAEAAEWNVHAYTLQATAVLGHTDASDEQGKNRARTLCQMALDTAAQCSQENFPVKLGVAQMAVVAAEKYLEWGELQNAQQLLSVVADRLNENLMEEAKNAAYHGELNKEAYLQNVQVAIMRLAADAFRLQAAVGSRPGMERNDADDRLLQGAFEMAEQLAPIAITWEGVHAGADLAAVLERQAQKGKRKWKECLKVTEETLDWIKRGENLRIVADVKRTQAKLLGIRSHCLCELKRYDEAIEAAWDQQKVAKERYEAAPSVSAGILVLNGYDREQTAWAQKAQASLFGKRNEAIKKQGLACRVALIFAKKVCEENPNDHISVIQGMAQHFREASF